MYLGLLEKARLEMAQRLDEEDYSVNETITIKIPFKLPYQEEDKTFERMHGDFQHDGEFYKLIKQKVENDTLYIICIRDSKEKKIFNFMADMVKMSTDLPAASASTKLLNSLIKDYLLPVFMIEPSQQDCLLSVVFHEQHFSLLTRDLPVFSPPPDLLS